MAEKLKEAAAPRNTMLRGNAVKLREVKANTFRPEVPADTVIEDLTRPSFWGAVQGPKGFDTIEVIWLDGTRFVECLVICAVVGSIQLQILRDVALDKAVVVDENALPAGYSLKFNSLAGKWRTVRDRDQHVMSEFPDKLMAIQELLNCAAVTQPHPLQDRARA